MVQKLAPNILVVKKIITSLKTMVCGLMNAVLLKNS
jgi:hypothetical protein